MHLDMKKSIIRVELRCLASEWFRYLCRDEVLRLCELFDDIRLYVGYLIHLTILS